MTSFAKLVRTGLPALLAALAVLTPTAARAQGQPPLKKLYALLVADTDSTVGVAAKADLDNMTVLLGNTVPAGRLEVTVLKGGDVTPEKILAYYNGVKAGPDDALFFYYTGHGGTDKERGHALTMSGPKGKLLRSDLLAAMKAKNAGLTVVLTDCCSNLLPEDSPKSKEPPGRVAPAGIQATVSALFFESRGVVDITAAQYDNSAWCDTTGSFFTIALADLVGGQKVTGSGEKVTWQDLFPALQEKTNGQFKDYRDKLLADSAKLPPGLKTQLEKQEAQVPTSFALPGTDKAATRWRLGAKVMLLPGGGVRVEAVTPGGPAAKAGLEKGDVISAINGRPFRTAEEYKALLDGSGGRVVLTLIDAGGKGTFNPTVPLEPQP